MLRSCHGLSWIESIADRLADEDDEEEGEEEGEGEEGEEEDEGKADCAATVLYSLYEAPMLRRLWLRSAAAQRPARELAAAFRRRAAKAAY